MAKNWGRTPVTNADKRFTAHIKYLVETPDGVMQRIDRRPLGKSEQFVDGDGNIIHLTMYGDGDSQKATTEQRNRAAAHRKGQIEYAKCPIRHGTRQHALRDFSKMPAHLERECPSDPKPYVRLTFDGQPAQRGEPGDLHAKQACPHIEWLIAHRADEAAKRRAIMNPIAARAESSQAQEAEIKALQAELLKEQLAERKQSRRGKKDPGGE